MKLIAEIGAAHNGKLKNVFRLMEETVQADAFKLQTWTSDSMSVPHILTSGPWAGKDLTALYHKARLPWDWHQDIFDLGRDLGKEVFSSPFDRHSVDFLEKLGCPRYKIASFEVVDLGLVEYIAQTGKPMILSTGQVTANELEKVLEVILKHNKDITLLYCISQYPTSFEEVSIRRMKTLHCFGIPVGISDHTPGDVVPIMATALGATMIEKHVGLTDRGLDGGFSMRTYQFNSMAIKVRQAEAALVSSGAEMNTNLRRSLYFARDMAKGETIRDWCLKTARPNKGLCPLEIKKILGKELTEGALKNQPVSLQLV